MSEMSNEEVKQLGQRLLKAGVPWMVGMRSTTGAVVVAVEDGVVAFYSEEVMDVLGDVSWVDPEDLDDLGIVPDLTDPATLGAALVHALLQVEGAQSIEDAARGLVAAVEK